MSFDKIRSCMKAVVALGGAASSALLALLGSPVVDALPPNVAGWLAVASSLLTAAGVWWVKNQQAITEAIDAIEDLTDHHVANSAEYLGGPK